MKLSSPRAAKALNQELTKLKTGWAFGWHCWCYPQPFTSFAFKKKIKNSTSQPFIAISSAKQTKTLQYWLKLFYKTYYHLYYKPVKSLLKQVDSSVKMNYR